jgi:Flp pilus assembly protein TadG
MPLSREAFSPGKARAQKRSGFVQEEAGSIAVLFALLLMPVLGIVLGGIDYSRAISLQNKLQTAADTAALSAASRLFEGKSAAETAFKAAFQSNLPPDLREQPYALSFSGDATAFQVEISSSVRTTLIAVLGVHKLDVAVAASASLPKAHALAGYGRGAPNTATVLGGETAEAARGRAELERALRSAGLPAEKLPTAEEIYRVQRDLMGQLESRGAPSSAPSNLDLPDPEEIQRLNDKVMRELGRLPY